MTIRRVFALGLAAMAFLPVGALAADAVVAQGRLEGVSGARADAYLGVPFAAPPVGALRWAPPQAPLKWSGVRQARVQPPSCMQPPAPPQGRPPWTPEFLIPANGPISEDCLYLNVWTPKGFAGKRLPVLVWIHGGGFTEGSASVPVYDGSNLAADGGIVVVAVNYRLGVFGFLAHPELSAAQGASGAYGYQDQVAALGWVRDNIAAFGGDPAQVTVAGQSAGAGSVMALVGAPAARGLFARAIAQSGPSLAFRGGSAAAAEANGAAFQTAVGAQGLADLRQKSAADILTAAADFTRTGGAGFRPVPDGRFAPMDPGAAPANDTPILAGYTLDEGSAAPDYGAWTTTQVEQQLEGLGPRQAQARALYLSGDDPGAAGKALARDRSMALLALWAERRAAQSAHRLFLYRFHHAEPGPQSARFGAFHTGEVPYVFNNLIGEGRVFTGADRQVAATVSGYWLNFVKTGDPNGAGLPLWPAFTAAAPLVMQLHEAPAPTPILAPERRALFAP